jgi:alkylation response protein AidB-like acyl-CoA dehydrogenase
MYLELDEQQDALRQMAAELLGDLSPLSRLREADPGPRREVWEQLAAPGLTGLGVPERWGGSGGSEVEAAVVIEQAGATLLPEPLRETIGVVVPLLLEHGTQDQRERWLGPIAAGEVMVGAALGPRRLLAGQGSVDAVLVVDGNGCLLASRDELEIRPWGATTDPSRDLGIVQDVAAGEEARLGSAEAAEAQARGAAATAAALVGVAQRLLDLAVGHARVREQFGTPIGSFQAVQHPLVDVHVAVESARPAAWYAALALRDGRPDAHAACRVAKAAANHAAALADRVALQVLAGIGFTWEHDLHLLSKRATVWRAEFGDEREHRRELGAALLDGGA